MTRRKIAVITGTRADYGHMKWLIHDLAERSDVDLQVVVTGTHLSLAHGMTIREIEADGIAIAARVEMLLASDTTVSVVKSMGLGLVGFADVFDRLRPDIVVLLGDRYEALVAAQAAMIQRIPIAHLHGGEATEGVIDEAIRHSLTKLAHFHFVAADAYAKRVAQLGEDPARIFNFGAPGLDHLTRTPMLGQAQLAQSLGIQLDQPLFLVTYHPVTLSVDDPTVQIHALTRALDAFPEATVVVTGVNADPNASAIDAVFHDWVSQGRKNIHHYSSLGFRRYLSLMAQASVVVGNSSSGIIEAPALHIPTVNIGPRQQGRLRGAAVIDCAADTPSIIAAITQALTEEAKLLAKTSSSPYGSGDASAKIADILAKYDLAGILVKRFHDLPH